MTSKSKGKYYQLNLNSNPNTKLKEANTKIKSNIIESLLQSSNLNQKNNKLGANLNINLNLNKNSNKTNNNSNAINLANLNHTSNLNNPNNPNSSSFRQGGLIAKKYKTSKNSPDKILLNFNERNYSGEKAAHFTSTFTNSAAINQNNNLNNKDLTKQNSGSIFNNTSTNLNTNTNTHVNTHSNNNSNSNSNINLHSNNTVYNLNINNHINDANNKNINININTAHPLNTIQNIGKNSTSNGNYIKIANLSGASSGNNDKSTNFIYSKSINNNSVINNDSQSKNNSKNKSIINNSNNFASNNVNSSGSKYDRMENIQINDTSFNNLKNVNSSNNHAESNSNNNNNINNNFCANSNISMTKMLHFKKEFLNVKNLNKDSTDSQAQCDMIIKQKLQKKKNEQQKNKSNFLNFTSPINHNNGTLINSSCKNNMNNNSVAASLENKYIYNLEDSKHFHLNKNISHSNNPQTAIANTMNLGGSNIKDHINVLNYKGINSNTIQYGLSSKLDTNSQERKQSKEYSVATTPCETELYIKKVKETQNSTHNNYINTSNLHSNPNNTNHSNTLIKSGQINITSDLSNTHTSNQMNYLYKNLINNTVNKVNSNNNLSNKITKSGTSQIKNTSHTNSNINIGAVLNNLHNGKINNNNNNFYNTNSKLNENNSKENLNKSNNNNNANIPITANNYNTNVNTNSAAGKSNINSLNNENHQTAINASNIKEISSTMKKNPTNTLNNSKIIKNNYIFNLNNPKTDLNIKAKVENKYENKSGKVDRIEKPDSSKYSKDKKDSSNYNKIVIFSDNYNPKILKERVFLTKQPTNKNSRKTSTEKNAEKIIAFYTNSLQQTHQKPTGKSTVISTGHIEKNNIHNLNGLNKDNLNHHNNYIDNLDLQKKKFFNVNNVLDQHNHLISAQNFQKMHNSAQSSIEKTKQSELFKSKNIKNPIVDYSLVNTEENAYEMKKEKQIAKSTVSVEKENSSSIDEKIRKHLYEEKYKTKYLNFMNKENTSKLKQSANKYIKYEANEITNHCHSLIDKNHDLSDISIPQIKKKNSSETTNEKTEATILVKKSNENLINLSSNKNPTPQGNLRYMQIDRNYLNASSDNKGILKDYVKGASISDASFKASLISHSTNLNNLKSKENSGININISNLNNNNNIIAGKNNTSGNNGVYSINNPNNNNVNETLNAHNDNKSSYLDKVGKANIAISVPITSKQSKKNSKNNSKSTTRVDENKENKRSKLIESEIKKFQSNISQLYKENKKKFSSGNSPLHEQILFKKDLPLNQNNFGKVTEISNTTGNTNNVNSINQSQSKNFDGENFHSNINLAKIKIDNPFRLNLNNLKNKNNNNNNNAKNNSKDILINSKNFVGSNNANNNLNKINKVNVKLESSNFNNFNNKNVNDNSLANINRNLIIEERSVDNLQENSQISEHSTFRESNYYRKESEKIANMIREYWHNTNQYPKTNLKFYKFGRLLGRGAFGKVNIGLHILSGRIVAIKSFNKKNFPSENSQRKIMHETNLMKNLHHPSIVRIFETFETQKYILIVMEYICGGDLLSFVRKRTKLNEPTAKFIFRQIIEGLQYIHSQNIVHRDIKLDNILIDLTNTVKICDFGVSRLVKKGEVMHDQCGTPAYIAPEILLNKGYEGFAVDVWSAGVVLYTMLAGVVPFKHKYLDELHLSIIQGKYEDIENVSAEAMNLIKRILHIDPQKRFSVDQILDHEWLWFDNLEENFRNKNKLILFTNAEKILLSKTNIDYRIANKDDIMENFTLKNLDTFQETENQNIVTKSLILAPFNSTLKKNENWKLASDLKIENDVMKICGKVKDANRNYELNNNGEIDNGFLINVENQNSNNQNNNSNASSAHKNNSKFNSGVGSKASFKSGSGVNSNSNSNANLNNLRLNASAEDDNNVNSNAYFVNNLSKKFTNSREYLLANSNNTVVIDENILHQMENFGYKREYLLKCLHNRELNYATAAYFLYLNCEKEN